MIPSECVHTEQFIKSRLIVDFDADLLCYVQCVSCPTLFDEVVRLLIKGIRIQSKHLLGVYDTTTDVRYFGRYALGVYFLLSSLQSK